MICRRFSLFWHSLGDHFVKRFALCYQSVVYLSVCTVCNVGVLWPDGWMDQDETRHAGSHRLWPQCIRWGPSCLSPKGAESSLPIFDPYLLWPNGCMDQDATWYGGRPRPRRLYVRWEPAPQCRKGGGAPLPKNKSAHVYCGQTAGWIKLALGMEVGLIPGDFALDGDTAPPQKGDGNPNFRPMSIAAKRLHGLRCHLVWR